MDETEKEVEVYYIWGESGCGKTTLALQMIRDRKIEYFHPVSHVGKFWLGVGDGKGCALYDNFRYSHMKVSEFIRFIDYDAHDLNVKGGHVWNKFNLIIITTI